MNPATSSSVSDADQGESLLVQPPVQQMNPGAGINYEYFLDCVHCGLCTASCPTYVELGDENDSPRGRIYLMRAVTDGRLGLTKEVRRHLELCLDCRACETACPSGVQYGKLIEPFRVAMENVGDQPKKSDDWFHRLILFGLFPFASRLRMALAPARWMQFLRLDRLILLTGVWRLLPARLGRLATMLPPLGKDEPPLPPVLPAKGEKRARVALFTGCVADAMFRRTHWATARVLQENGCEVVTPGEQVCCGAIHLHAGASEGARELADKNAAIFNPDDVDAIILNVAGCGAMLKDYGHHWAEEQQAGGQQANDQKTNAQKTDTERQTKREKFAAKVKDVSEFLDALGVIPPQGEINTAITYHDACHLAHAQKIREQPRNLLSLIPGLTIKELPESDLCCGAAGTYNLTEPEMSDRLSQRKLNNILGTGARVVATANAGCLLQIMREARVQGKVLKVVHPMELLDMSYRGEPLNL